VEVNPEILYLEIDQMEKDINAFFWIRQQQGAPKYI